MLNQEVAYGLVSIIFGLLQYLYYMIMVRMV